MHRGPRPPRHADEVETPPQLSGHPGFRPGRALSSQPAGSVRIVVHEENRGRGGQEARAFELRGVALLGLVAARMVIAVGPDEEKAKGTAIRPSLKIIWSLPPVNSMIRERKPSRLPLSEWTEKADSLIRAWTLFSVTNSVRFMRRSLMKWGRSAA